jgi:calpain-9
LQKTNRGRINFNDFKMFIVNLKTWHGVFKIHAKEKSGILRAERFRDALFNIGFQINTEILSMLVLRYMRRDGTMRLADFVSAILHLTMAFGKPEKMI